MGNLAPVFRHLTRTFAAAGFRPRGNCFVRNGLSARIDESWCVFRGSRSRRPSAHADGGPGLWKPVPNRASSRATFEFHLPLGAFEAALAGSADEQTESMREVIDWVASTYAGAVPSSWQPPSRGSLEDWIPAQRYTAQADPFVRQGALTANEQQISIAISIASTPVQALSPARRSWLQALTNDAQRRYRMVRVTTSHPCTAAPGVWATTDLTGAPDFVLPDLLRLAVDATRHVATRLLTAVSLLCQSDLACATWEVAAGELFSQDASCGT